MLADFASQIADGHVFVAQGENDLLQGFIAFYPQERRMLLENVAVRADMSGRGIGKALIRFCEDQTRRLSLNAVHLYTNAKMTENLVIYSRLGYEQIDRRTQDGFDRVLLEKRLRHP